MAALDDVVIISGCRTPVGKFQGSLSDLTAPQLGAVVVREAVKRVAEHLNNTPTVARSSYIDRRVVDLFLDGVSIDVPVGPTGAFTSRHRADLEDAVRSMLKDPTRRSRAA